MVEFLVFQFNEISWLNQCSNNKDLSTHMSQYKLKIHAAIISFQLQKQKLIHNLEILINTHGTK